MSNDLLLRGGTLVTATDTYEADLLVCDGRISNIGEGLSADCEILDVSGKLVIPGAIDTHTHLAHEIGRLGLATADDFHSGTIAAACGGVTTIVDFAVQHRGESLEQALENRLPDAEGKAVIDFGFHIILTDVSEDILREIPHSIEMGCPSFKIYMTYRDKIVDDSGLLKVLEQSAEHGGLVYVHCENDCAVTHLIDKSLSHGEVAPRFHAHSRPPLVEGEATNRALALAELVGAPICVAHVTAAESLERIEAARYRGVSAFCETCPQYLVLTDDRYAADHGFDAAKFVCSPPLRDETHRQALWGGLRRGSIQQVSSDHAPFRFTDQKELGRKDFTKIPNGLPGIENRVALLFSEGVSTGRLSLNRFVALVSTNPAKLFGLYPTKGSLVIGADADLAVIDPGCEQIIDYRKLHHQVDYSPYDGMCLRGVPVLTIARGMIVSRDGQPTISTGRGRFVPRRPWGNWDL